MATEKKRQMLGRIKLKEASEKRKLRKLRNVGATLEARILYDDFVNDGGGSVEETIRPLSREHDSDGSDEEFWFGLSGIESPAPRTEDRKKEPWECTQRMARPSRMQRLLARRSGENELVQS